ncbi:MAG TPA: triose-phosphate isomerase, partial [Anaerolineae bacterium]|nr:triose-phosphate isomerase [Anaerolineae bacterium]
TIDEAVALVQAMRQDLDQVETVESVVCPPFVALSAVANVLAGTRIGLGAQNMHWEPQGAYTGEIAPTMLQGLCQYVILGHSERRGYFGETDEMVNKKVHAALAYHLAPIICVGENLEQNRAGKTNEIVRRQITAALDGLTGEQVVRLVIAYEPIWAIGTGLAATGEDANHVIGQVVRGTIAELFGDEVAQIVRIQYGGSTKPENIAEFMSQPEIDGALVGGASLKADSFTAMVRITARIRA